MSLTSVRLVQRLIKHEMLNQALLKMFCAKESTRRQSFLSTAVLSVSPPRTAAVIGASGDIGSTPTDYLVCDNLQLICSIRQSSSNKLTGMMRTECADSGAYILIEDMLDLTNLRAIIQQAVLYSLVGSVLSFVTFPKSLLSTDLHRA